MDVISSFLSHWNKIERRKNGDRLIHIHRNRRLHYSILAHSQMSIQNLVHTLLHTHIHSIIFPPHVRALFIFYNKSGRKKISIWFKWHRRVWFSLFICSQKLEKNNKLHLTLNYIKSEIVETIWPHCAWNVYAGFSVHLSVWSSLKIILHALVSFQWFSVCLHSRRRKEEVAGATVSLLSLLVAISPLPPSFSQCSNIRI